MKQSPAILRIGSVAAAAGLTVDAVRYYERLGLLKPEARTDGGFRTYGRDAVQRLEFIRQAQRIGLQLREIRDLLAARGASGKQHCERVRSVLVARLGDVEMQMSELRTFQRTLRTALHNCEIALSGEEVDECPVVRTLIAKGTKKSGSKNLKAN